MTEQHNHVATTPNKPPPLAIDVFRTQLISPKGDFWNKIVNYFGGDEEKARKFASALTYSVQKNPKLLDADRASLFNAGMACAEFKLYPSNVAGEAFIIPYKGKAQFQLGYQGLITLLARAGFAIHSEIVRKNDKFEYEGGLVPKLHHSYKPFQTAEERGEPVGAYATASTNGIAIYHKVMSAAEILGIKEFSQAKESEYSPWNGKNDPELWMWKKTVIKQLAKLIPKTEEITKAIAIDNEESTIAARQSQLDAGGPAVGASSHKPEEVETDRCPAGKHDAKQVMADGICPECVKEQELAEAGGGK
jgi:recombination protein RecT